MISLFVTALFGAIVTVGVFGSGEAHAQSSCAIGNFVNPDKTIDTTGYLACVAAASASAVKPSADCPIAEIQLLGTADPSTVSPGQSVNYGFVGFRPDSPVELFICSTPVSLGNLTADASGNVNGTVTIPSGTVLGAHTLAATGARSNGLNQVAYASITVVSATPTGTLPTTGTENGRLIAMGAALVVLGGAAIFGSTRARRPALVETD